MSGLRERKKREAYRSILEAGKQVFYAQGYDDTTMEKLAEQAGIGVGTIYNYFQSKADIFLAIVEDELNPDDIGFRPEAEDMEKGAQKIVWRFLYGYLTKIKKINRWLFRETFYATMNMMRADNRFFHRLASLDYQFIHKLRALLDMLKEKGLFPDSFDTDTASMVMYSVIMTQTMLYAFDKNIPFKHLEDTIRAQIAFTLQGKTKGTEENDACLSQ